MIHRRSQLSYELCSTFFYSPSLLRFKCNNTRTFGEKFCTFVDLSGCALQLHDVASRQPRHYPINIAYLPSCYLHSASSSEVSRPSPENQRPCGTLLDTIILALPPDQSLKPSRSIVVFQKPQMPSTVVARTRYNLCLIFGNSASFVPGFDRTYSAGRVVVNVGLFGIWVRRC
jgi:hypothetical protein